MNITPRRYMWIGLASIVLNVFLIGFVAGRQAFGPGGCSARMSGPGSRGPGGPLMRALSEEDRLGLRKQADAVRAAREGVREALLHEPFDAAKLEAALAAQRAQSEALGAKMHENLLEFATSASPEERRRLAESRFMRRHRRMDDGH